MNDDKYEVEIVAKLVDKVSKPLKALARDAMGVASVVGHAFSERLSQTSKYLSKSEIAERAEVLKGDNGMQKDIYQWEDFGSLMADKWKGIGKETDKARKKVLRYSLALFGVTSIYRGIIKAVNTYMSVNQELQARVNGLYYAIGSLLAPVIEWVLNLLSRWVLYIDAFARGIGLAGINMTNFNKTASKTSKMLAPFDEINNLTEGNSGSNSGITDPFGGESAGMFGEKFRLFGEWCKENIPIITGLVGGLLTFIELMKLGIEGFGTKALGIAIIVGSVITFVQDLIKALKDPTFENWGKVIIDIGVALLGVSLILDFSVGQWVALAGAVAVLAGVIIANWSKVSDWFKETCGKITDWFKRTFGDTEKNHKAMAANIGKVSEGMLENILKGIGKFFVNLGNKLGIDVKEVINKWIITPLNKVIGWINGVLNFSYGGLKLLGKTVIPAFSVNLGHLKSVAYLDQGTNYVPNDQLAMIHQGEAVIPKKFNSSEYFNSDETNELLQTLIERVDAIELNPYVTVTDVGKASVKYINQQARIKGGSVL